MTTLVLEHLPASELPLQWAQQLNALPEQTVTVRIETEAQPGVQVAAVSFVTADPAFGIWRDRNDAVDVAAFARRLRAPRYGNDGSRKEDEA